MMRLLAMGFILLSLAGCGYTTGSVLPDNYRVIAVEPFKNKISFVSENTRGLYLPQLETKVYTSVKGRFLFDGHLRVDEMSKADLLLTGDLTSFDREELSLNDDRNVREYRIRITVALVMTDMATGKVLWTEPSFSGEATYLTSGAQAKSETAALEDALIDLSRRVVERTLENW